MTPNHSNRLINQALSVYAPPRSHECEPTIEIRSKLCRLLFLIQPGHEEFIAQRQNDCTDKQAKNTGEHQASNCA